MANQPHATTICSAGDVARRALCIGSLILRGHLENEVQTERRPADLVQRAARGLDQWMEREGLRAHCSKKELALLQAAPGSWEEDDIADASWRGESLGMLCWALAMLPAPPPWDTMFELEPALPMLGLLGETGPALARATLREPEVILRLRDVAEAWHWRERSDQLQRRAGLVPTPSALQAALKRIGDGDGGVQPLGGDFPAFGKPYRELSPPEATTCGFIARERHYAMNWLCGVSDDWDRVPTDT